MNKNILVAIILLLGPVLQAEQESKYFEKLQESARICGTSFKFNIPNNYVLVSEHKDDISTTLIFTPAGNETKEKFTSSITYRQLYVDQTAKERLNDIEKQLTSAEPSIKAVKRFSQKSTRNNREYQKSTATYVLKNNGYSIATTIICYADEDSIIEVQASAKNREKKKAQKASQKLAKSALNMNIKSGLEKLAMFAYLGFDAMDKIEKARHPKPTTNTKCQPIIKKTTKVYIVEHDRANDVWWH